MLHIWQAGVFSVMCRFSLKVAAAHHRDAMRSNAHFTLGRRAGASAGKMNFDQFKEALNSIGEYKFPQEKVEVARLKMVGDVIKFGNQLDADDAVFDALCSEQVHGKRTCAHTRPPGAAVSTGILCGESDVFLEWSYVFHYKQHVTCERFIPLGVGRVLLGGT